MNKAKGINANIATKILPVNIWYKNVDNIFNKVWPAHILAKSRTPKLNARAL